ncbi:gliding motility lipoprotein GldB [Pedobacter sp. BS3]|uniref:gliding motility lipoprotein GldB n=1 Tax=Pedobacter sp. BS3 TaxID=2567937 RepID=UPI0011EDC7DC|nr:gliding motility lipoprotein GldB [Pedobacter sp. BS3]TZF80913.1 gliding motility lipoprotein GldB [Pedobacter sp. BS3]
MRVPFKPAQIYLFFLISLLAVSCGNNKRVDVSNIHLNVSIERFDKDLGQVTAHNLNSKASQLNKKYGFFYRDYMEKMLAVGSVSDTGYYANLRTVLQNKDYQELYQTTQQTFPNLDKQQAELTDAFKHIKYYYPKTKLPRLIAYISGFAVQTPIGNDYVGIGLDMFLGARSKFYPALRESIPAYISRRFTPENITPRVMESYIREDLFPEPDADKSLISRMIYNGKILYFMDAVMPDIADSLKIGYTKQQMEWAKTYEPDIWGYFLERNLVYETDYFKIQGYLTEAPFTPDIGEKNDSAPKLGLFIGWQIVKKYMEKNPDVTVQQLMQETDFQKILNDSHYRPK